MYPLAGISLVIIPVLGVAVLLWHPLWPQVAPPSAGPPEALAGAPEGFEIEIDDVTYCTNDDENGFIWELTEEGEQGNKVGYFKEGEPFFYADEN